MVNVLDDLFGLPVTSGAVGVLEGWAIGMGNWWPACGSFSKDPTKFFRNSVGSQLTVEYTT